MSAATAALLAVANDAEAAATRALTALSEAHASLSLAEERALAEARSWGPSHLRLRLQAIAANSAENRNKRGPGNHANKAGGARSGGSSGGSSDSDGENVNDNDRHSEEWGGAVFGPGDSTETLLPSEAFPFASPSAIAAMAASAAAATATAIATTAMTSESLLSMSEDTLRSHHVDAVRGAASPGIHPIHPSKTDTSNRIRTSTSGSVGGGLDVHDTTASTIHWVGISKQGMIITYSRDDGCLRSFSLNGSLLARSAAGAREGVLCAFCFSDDGRVLLCGGTGRLVAFRWVHNLGLANDGPREGFEALVDGSCAAQNVPPFPATIRSITMSDQERHLMIGLQNGEVYFLAPDSNYLHQRLQKQLEYLGFY